MPSAVAFRYARSLVDVVTDPERPSVPGQAAPDPRAIAAHLRDFAGLLRENRELEVLLTTPAVAEAKKSAVLTQITPLLGVDPLTRNFLQVVLAHDRIPYLGEIAEAYDALLNERLGVVIAEVRSAHPLTEPGRQELARALRARTGKQVEMDCKVDPDLIAGVVVQMGTTIYDASIRGQLERLRADLKTQSAASAAPRQAGAAAQGA